MKDLAGWWRRHVYVSGGAEKFVLRRKNISRGKRS